MPLGPLKNSAFIARFDSYFVHPGSQQLALSEGEKSDACVNIRAALNALGIRQVRSGDKFLFDTSLSDSKASKNRNWPSWERELAVRIEDQFGQSVLAYVLLDDVPLKASDRNRIAIEAYKMPLKDVGREIQKALGVLVEYPRVDYREDELL